MSVPINNASDVKHDSLLPIEDAADYVLSEGAADDAPKGYTERARKYLTSDPGQELGCCALLGGLAYFIGYLWTTPHQRPIPVQFLEDTGVYILNLAHNESYTVSSVPEWELGLVVLMCPLLQILCGLKYGMVNDTHRTLCVYLLAIPLNELVTWTLKVYVGYLRPSFYALCQPDENYESCTADEEWQDGRMSFPSGHASYAFCSLMLLHLYLEQRCFGFGKIAHQVKREGNRVVQPPQALWYRMGSILCLIPLGFAIYIACSRVVDNKHFPADIVAGGLLGASIAKYFHYLCASRFLDHRQS